MNAKTWTERGLNQRPLLCQLSYRIYICYIPCFLRKHFYFRKLDAYIGDYVYDFYRISTKEFCSDLTIIQDDTYVTSYTFPVTKNSKLKEKLSDEIRTMKYNGQAANIIDKWLGNVNCSTTEPGADKFSWQYAGGLLVLMGASLALGLLVILCEKLYIQFWVGRKLKNATENNN